MNNNNETTTKLSSYDSFDLVTEMTIVNDAVDTLIGGPVVNPTLTALAAPLMARYNDLRNELIRRTSELN